ncbi:hypothetical protein [Streptomyces sp. H27-H5]|uniref:hypothetical protein n=1 Tax=Streptomyces sp. H27-H5 TaxID=2996460 RepID=UPI0022703077|nr:hypothetical protein [Streptomyces sp. H27-H5]MCY0957663.1 hypothetical protein [Streptomyces sp. H27-H5]
MTRPPTGVLNWRDGRHWSERELPCRYCGRPTNLRDSARHPAHKLCAEAAIRQQIADQAEAYENERLTDREEHP